MHDFRDRRRIFLPALMLFSAAGFAQTPGVLQPGRVDGRVVSALGAPIAKVSVQLVPGGGTPPTQQGPNFSYLETSASDGSFHFENLPPGRYNLLARRPGFGPPQQPQVLTLAAGEALRDVEVKMNPLSVVTGKVIDGEGDPVPNVQVRLVRHTFQQGRARLTQSVSANTDDRGIYRIANVPAGRYYVQADDLTGRGPQTQIRGRSAQGSNLPTYYPDTTRLSNARRLELRIGMQVENVDIRLVRGQALTLRGTVTDASGAPLQAMIALVNRDAPLDTSMAPLQTITQAATGTFYFGSVPAGDYILTARTNTPRPAQPLPPPPPGAASVNGAVGVVMQAPFTPAAPQPVLFGRFNVSVRGSEFDAGVLRLAPGPSVTGRIILEGEGELGQMQQTIVNGAQTSVLRPATLTLMDMVGPTNQVSARVAPDGSFTLLNLPPSLYGINAANLTRQGYLKSVKMAGQDVTHQILDFTTGAAGPLEITIGNQPAQVMGIAQNSKREPAVNATVVVWPKDPQQGDPTGGIRNGRSNDTGGFNLQGLAPGEYYAAAFEDADPDLLRVPEFLARFNRSSKTFKVTEGGSASVDPNWIGRDVSEPAAATFPE